MKFIYQYRTKDNVSHRGIICAANRDAAYAALKSQGVKPGRMEEAPGFFNKFFGKGKRWIAIAVLALSTVALAVILFTREEVSVDPYSDKGFARPIERRQIWGDEVVVDAATQSNWREVFDSPSRGRRSRSPCRPMALRSSSRRRLPNRRGSATKISKSTSR